MSKFIYKDTLQTKYNEGTILTDDVKCKTLEVNKITSDNPFINIDKDINLNSDLLINGDLSINGDINIEDVDIDTIKTNTITSDNNYVNFNKGISTTKYLSIGNNNYNITTDGGLCIGNFADQPYNDGIFKIGIGTDNNNRKTGLLFDNNGVLTVNDKIITNDLQSKNGNNIIKIYDNSIVVSKDGGTNWSGLIKSGTGNNSIVLNNSNNVASGNNSFCEGLHNISNTGAFGERSHCEGYQNYAQGNNSHAEGYRTTASGFISHAEGHGTLASVNYSHASGYYTISNTVAGTAIGKYNISGNNKLFVVGNGTADNARSDAFVVYDDGNILLNNTLFKSGTGHSQFLTYAQQNYANNDNSTRSISNDDFTYYIIGDIINITIPLRSSYKFVSAYRSRNDLANDFVDDYLLNIDLSNIKSSLDTYYNSTTSTFNFTFKQDIYISNNQVNNSSYLLTISNNTNYANQYSLGVVLIINSKGPASGKKEGDYGTYYIKDFTGFSQNQCLSICFKYVKLT